MQGRGDGSSQWDSSGGDKKQWRSDSGNVLKVKLTGFDIVNCIQYVREKADKDRLRFWSFRLLELEKLWGR